MIFHLAQGANNMHGPADTHYLLLPVH